MARPASRQLLFVFILKVINNGSIASYCHFCALTSPAHVFFKCLFQRLPLKHPFSTLLSYACMKLIRMLKFSLQECHTAGRIQHLIFSSVPCCEESVSFYKVKRYLNSEKSVFNLRKRKPQNTN